MTQQKVSILFMAKDYASATTASLQKKITGLITPARAATAALVGIAAAAAGFVLAAKAAASFEKRMLNVNTITKVSRDRFEEMSDQVLELSKRVPKTAEDLADSLYQIASASIPAENQMQFLAASANAASAGLTETETAADALTTVINAWGKSATEVNQVSDVFFKTVERGKTTFGELANSIAYVAATAADAGIEFEEVTAGLATLTRQGLKTEMATIALNQAILSILKPSEAMAHLIKLAGYESGAAAFESDNLAEVFGRLSKAANENGIEMRDVVSNVRAMRAIIPLAGSKLGEFTDDLERMNSAAGATSKAIGIQEQGAAYQFQIMKNNMQAIRVEIGEHLLPAMNNMSAGLVHWIENSRIVIPLFREMAEVLGVMFGGFGTTIDDVMKWDDPERQLHRLRALAEIFKDMEGGARQYEKAINAIAEVEWAQAAMNETALLARVAKDAADGAVENEERIAAARKKAAIAAQWEHAQLVHKRMAADIAYIDGAIDAEGELSDYKIQKLLDYGEEAAEAMDSRRTARIRAAMAEVAIEADAQALTVEQVRTAQQEMLEIRAAAHVRQLMHLEDQRIALDAYVTYAREAHRSMAEFITGAASATYGAIENNLAGVLSGQKSLTEGVRDFGKAMLEFLATYIAKHVAAMAAMAILRKTGLAAAVITGSASAAALAAAWAPAAALASLASFGANAVPAQLGITSTVALSQAMALPKVALAEGGLVTRPTIALIGEAGPEMVIPLDRLATREQAAPQQTVIIDKIEMFPNVTTVDLIEAIEESPALLDRLRQAMEDRTEQLQRTGVL